MRVVDDLRARWSDWRENLSRVRRRLAGRRACPCCGHLTLESDPGSWEICEVCFWEDDPVQRDDPSCVGGANRVSLAEARENFRRHGASDLEFQDSVRPPRPSELPKGS